MRRVAFWGLLLCLILWGLMGTLARVSAQPAGWLTEGFAQDGPPPQRWAGTRGQFICRQGRLLPFASGAGRPYLSTPYPLADTATWTARLTIDRAPSTQQTFEWWLMADGADLSVPQRQGYLMRLGAGTPSQPDPGFELIRQTAGGGRSTLATLGRGLCTAGADLTVYVARGPSGSWWLGIDSGGHAQPHRGLTVGDPAPDGWQQSRSWLGVCLPHVTGAGTGGYLIDSLAAGPIYGDVTPPRAVSAQARGARIEVSFSEPIDTLGPWRLEIEPRPAGVAGPWRWQAGGRRAYVTLTAPQPEGIDNWAVAWQVRDMAGLLGQGSMPLQVVHLPGSGDLALTELKPGGQTPPGGWPACPWLEIENLTPRALALDSVWLAVNGGTRRHLPAGATLEARRRAVLVSSACGADAGWRGLPAEGRLIIVSQMPTLPDAVATVVLGLGRSGIVERVSYQPRQWSPASDLPYYSLERIDPRAPCGGGQGWGQSPNARGGTPGTRNDLDGVYRDLTAPTLLSRQWQPGGRLVLTFDEPLAWPWAGARAGVQVGYPGAASSASARGVFVDSLAPERLIIELAADSLPRPGGPPLTLTVTGLADCPGNQIDPSLVLTLSAPRAPEAPGELWISEVLSHPYTGGQAFVEVCNLTADELTLAGVRLRRRQPQTGGPPGTPLGQRVDSVDLSPVGLIGAGQCRFLTRLQAPVMAHYPRTLPATGVELSLPGLPRTEVLLELLTAQGVMLDRAHPRQKDHSPALDQTQGVSWQRHLPDEGDTAGALAGGRWHSTARTDGYATPGFRPSSQTQAGVRQVQAPGQLTVEPAVISPNGDGRQDRTRVTLTLPPGWAAAVVTLEILSPEGVILGTLARAETMVGQAHWWWEGRAPSGGRLPPGPYVLLARVQPTTGQVAPLRLRAVVALHY